MKKQKSVKSEVNLPKSVLNSPKSDSKSIKSENKEEKSQNSVISEKPKNDKIEKNEKSLKK